MEAGSCTSPSVETQGGSIWNCALMSCPMPVAACAADCTCNDAIAQALACSASGMSSTMSCFVQALTVVVSDPTVTALIPCLDMVSTACGAVPDAGVLEASDPICTPHNCSDIGANCGENADGCGGLIECGACTPPQVCGGGGYSRCG
jgi:hypothetical protein